MNRYFVTGTWWVECDNSAQAESLVENAVAAMVPNSELNDCNAEIEDEGDVVEECEHEWEEQPGEPPVDACVHCGKVRE